VAQHFKDLVAWQKAMDLVVEVYKVSEAFPRRGQAHFSHREFLHFLRHASGSLAEIETQMIIAQRLGYVSDAGVKEILERVHEVGRILGGLMASITKRTT